MPNIKTKSNDDANKVLCGCKNNGESCQSGCQCCGCHKVLDKKETSKKYGCGSK
jgi:hypothetical protein